MITNDIQELLDGTLGDERMAELLHTLSVSPEKRAAFRQHLALGATMQRDRNAVALTLAEDAAIWSSISGGSSTLAPTGAARPFVGWFARAAAVVVVGVTGYLLGASTTNVVQGPDTDRPSLSSQTTPGRPGTATARPSASGVDGASTATSSSTPISISAVPSTTARASGRIAAGIAPRSSRASDRNDLRSMNFGRGNRQETASISTPPATALSAVEASSSDASSDALATLTMLSPASAHIDPLAAQTPTAPTTTHLRRQPVDEIGMSSVEPIAALRSNGFELAFNERVGMLIPAPAGIADPDPEFSNRSLDGSYRFLDGMLGLGIRATYGTISSVTLEADSKNETGIVEFVPKLEANKGVFLDLFVNMRVPLGERFAIGGELSAGGSTSFTKFGGDIFGLYFLTDNIGLQAGVGLGGYLYNLSDQREKLFRENASAGISSDASDKYRGTMLEGRYGLLWRF